MNDITSQVSEICLIFGVDPGNVRRIIINEFWIEVVLFEPVMVRGSEDGSPALVLTTGVRTGMSPRVVTDPT